MWKPDIARNINLNSHRSAKKGHKPGRALRLETLETRTMFYADPLTLSMPDTPALVGEPEPAGPLPEYFLQKQGPTSQINPSQIDRDVPQNAPVTIDPHANDGNLFPLGRPTPPNRYVPAPIGVFPDGSVRTVHPEIDPIVVEYMDNHSTGPIRDSLHRPGIGTGAPVGTIAGTDPRLLEHMTLQENWEHGVGPVIQTTQAIEISPDNRHLDVAAIYEILEDFGGFNDGNIADITIHKPGVLDSPLVQDQRFAVFTVKTLGDAPLNDPFWHLMNTMQLIINEPNVAVRLHNLPDEHEVFGVTLEKHMLVGARVWRVYEQDSGWTVIETEAWEQRNGVINDVAAEIAGRAAMEEIWTRYLTNIANKAATGEGRFHVLPKTTTVHPAGTVNPWKGRADKYRDDLHLHSPLITR
ncbi:MAG: hypothetical protein VX761_03130 [Planctomycetota bacterium]|nr:hypothetical protein [Planctomycetota bacterium]